jgi:hypothetical protein
VKKLFFIAIIVLLFLSCNNGDMEINPFIGTWENENRQGYVFTKTDITNYYYEEDERIIWISGTYTYDDTHITITTDYRHPNLEGNPDPNPYVRSYLIENDILKIGVPSFRKISQ